jgi:hypothetical protein
MSTNRTALTAAIAAFARPAQHSFLVIRGTDSQLGSYKTSYATDEGTATFESFLGIQHPDRTVTAVDLSMIFAFTGRVAVMPFNAPLQDNHTYGFASRGLQTTAQRAENAARRENASQQAAIAALAAQGVTVQPDPIAVAQAAANAANQAGGGSYGIMFETPISLYDGHVCNVFIPFRQLGQLLFLAYGQALPFIHDQSPRHTTSATPLVEITSATINSIGTAALYLGFPVRADGTPLVTNQDLLNVWMPWQHLAESLSLIVASINPVNNATTAFGYIRPATLIEMIWNTTTAEGEVVAPVQLVANPLPGVAAQGGVTAARTVHSSGFTKKLA